MQNHSGLIPPDFVPDLLTLLALVIKSGVFGMLLLLGLILFASRRDDRGRAAGLFTFGIANYLICTVVHDRAFFWPAVLVYVGCAAVPFLLWLFTRALFDDGFRLKFIHLAGGMAFVSLQLGGAWLERVTREPASASGLWLLTLVPEIVTIGLIFAALVYVVRGWSADLVETRRQFRMIFTSIAGGYALVVTVIEIALRGSPAPAAIEFVHAVALSLTTLFFGVRLLAVRADIFPPASVKPENYGVAVYEVPPVQSGAQLRELTGGLPRAGTPPTEPADPVPADPALLDGLAALMAARVWTEEGLTIRTLAAKLLVPEYRLRQAINGALGFRNFNDYLNRYRVAEACVVLADPARADVPVLRVAMDLGYGSLAPFNRAFRQLTGRTPTDFRRAPGDVPGLDGRPLQEPDLVPETKAKL